MKRPLRAIFFDIDDTLYSTTSFAEAARVASIEAMRDLGLEIGLQDALRELAEVIAEFGSNFGLHYDKFLRRLPPVCAKNVNPAMLIAASVIAYHRIKHEKMRAASDVPPALRELARTDLLLGVITNGWEIKQAEKLLRLGLYPYFHPQAIFISDQIGVSKPNPKIFLHALNTFALKPQETMFVGDRFSHDVVPARAVGLVTVLINRKGKHEAAPPQGEEAPDFSISAFPELVALVKEHFDVVFPSAKRSARKSPPAPTPASADHGAPPTGKSARRAGPRVRPS